MLLIQETFESTEVSFTIKKLCGKPSVGSFEPHVVFIQVKISLLTTQLNRLGHLTRSQNVPIVDSRHATNFTN